jgi:curved DNA-binding protein CbpA
MAKAFPWAGEDLYSNAARDWPYNEPPWDILGVKPTATEDEIREAQRRISREVHPDKPGGSEERQRAVNRAAEEMLKMRSGV